MQFFICCTITQNLVVDENNQKKMLSNFSGEETISSTRQHINKTTSNIHGDAINSDN
jgi:predicted transcriptional regulator